MPLFFTLQNATSSAQDLRGLEGLFGGIVGAAVDQQNRSDWARLAKDERACLAVGLRKQGSTLQQYIQAGVSPNDERIASIRSTCVSVIHRKLRRNVECPINTPSGVFVSRCDEDFATAEDPTVKIEQNRAIEAAFAPEGVTTALFERPDAMTRREQMISSGAVSRTVVSPNFDCTRATIAADSAICNSAGLSALDAEYGSLFRRYTPSGRANPVARQAEVFNKRRGECGTSEDCIRRNLEASIQYMARVLRKSGDQVETSTERAQKLAAMEVEKARAEQRNEAQAARERMEQELAAKRRADQEQQAVAERIAAARREADERAKVEADRLARLHKLTLDTNDLVTRAADFLKYDGGNPRLLIVAEAIASANAALETKDVDQVDKAKQALDGALRDDPKFADFQAARAEQQSQENARLLSDAMAQAQKQVRFLRSYIAQNPTSAAARSAIGLVKEADREVADHDLRKLRVFSASVDDMLRQYDLQTNYLLSLNAVDDKARETPSGAPANLDLVATAKNRFLMDGAADDLILMYVSAPSAPDVVRNLKGDIVFDQGKAIVCLYQAKPPASLRDRIRNALDNFKIEQLLVQSDACASDLILSNDVIAVERGVFLKQDVAYASALLKEIELGHVRPLASVSSTQVATALQSVEAKRKRLEADIEHGSLDGFALVVLPASPSEKLCGAIHDGLEAHEAILNRVADPTVSLLRKKLDLEATTFEDVFKDVQRSRCSAVYASASDLKMLLEALRRDRIVYQIYETPIALAEVNGEQSLIAKARADEEKDALERQRSAEDAQTLKAIRERDLQSTRAAQQAALRSKFDKVANSNAADISNDFKAYFTAGGDVQEGRTGASIPNSYPFVAQWYGSALRDHWSLQSVDADLEDYGGVDWKGRALEAVISTLRVRLRNAIVGEYRDGCFKVGHVIDHEFKVVRDPIDVSCDDVDGLVAWKQGHAFKSVWNLN